MFFSIAPDYVSVFDGYDYGVDEEMSTEVSCDPMQQGLPSIGQAQPISLLPPSQASHYPPPGVTYTPSLAHVPYSSLHSHSYTSLDIDRDHPSSSFQHDSHDSEEGLTSLTSRGYPLMSATCSSGGPDYKTLDSGETMLLK